MQGLLEVMTGGVPATQVPLELQVEMPVHWSPPQVVPVAAGVYVTPLTGSHEPTRHGFEVLMTAGVPGLQVPLELQVETPTH